MLAIDPGERRLGLAVSDPTGGIALPLEVYHRTGWAAYLAYLRRLIEIHGITELVVGRPITLRGTVGPQGRIAERLAQRLREALGLPVIELDERFSTAAATRALEVTGRTSRRRRQYRDAVAAALILQPYLDRRRRDEALRDHNEGVMLAP